MMSGINASPLLSLPDVIGYETLPYVLAVVEILGRLDIIKMSVAHIVMASGTSTAGFARRKSVRCTVSCTAKKFWSVLVTPCVPIDPALVERCIFALAAFGASDGMGVRRALPAVATLSD